MEPEKDKVFRAGMSYQTIKNILNRKVQGIETDYNYDNSMMHFDWPGCRALDTHMLGRYLRELKKVERDYRAAKRLLDKYPFEREVSKLEETRKGIDEFQKRIEELIQKKEEQERQETVKRLEIKIAMLTTVG